jgi:hypothetical protein
MQTRARTDPDCPTALPGPSADRSPPRSQTRTRFRSPLARTPSRSAPDRLQDERFRRPRPAATSSRRTGHLMCGPHVPSSILRRRTWVSVLFRPDPSPPNATLSYCIDSDIQFRSGSTAMAQDGQRRTSRSPQLHRVPSRVDRCPEPVAGRRSSSLHPAIGDPLRRS